MSQSMEPAPWAISGPRSVYDTLDTQLANIEDRLGDGAATTDDIRDLVEVLRLMCRQLGAAELNRQAALSHPR